MTTRDIKAPLQEIYGVEISPTLVSQVTQAVQEEITLWQNRPLDEVYPIVYLDAIRVKVRQDGRVINKAIYQAPTIDQAEINLEQFETKWNASHPAIGKTWRRNWERITPRLSYPPEIRKAIYTTNAIESVNMSLRKVTKNRGSFSQ